jgi:hypothetical protein
MAAFAVCQQSLRRLASDLLPLSALPCVVATANSVLTGGLDSAALAAGMDSGYGAAAEGILSPRDQQQQRPMRHSDTAAAAGQQSGGYADVGAGGDLNGELSRGAVGISAAGGGGSSFKAGTYDAAAQQQVVHTYQAYEDRPAVAKASYMSQAGQEVLGLDDDALIRADPSTVSAAALFGARGTSTAGGAGSSKLSMGGAGAAAAVSAASAARDYGGGSVGSGHTGGGACCTAPAPAGWPGDLPPPEPLTASSSSDAAPVIEVAGEFVAAAFFSRNWQLRDAAAAWLADLVGNGRLSGGPGAEHRELAKGLVRLAVRGLKDKVPQVYSSCLGLLQVGGR